MAWISKNEYLTQEEMENNADIVISYYKSIGVDNATISALLANMQSESTLSPILNERGGGGYGLVQWTPKSVLETACNTFNLHPYTSGDIQLRVIIEEMLTDNTDVKQWYSTAPFIVNYYNSGASSDMIGITAQDFLYNKMKWSPEKLSILFMCCYERPSYDPSINHYENRRENAVKWYNYITNGSYTPITPTPTIKNKKGYNFVLFNRKRRFKV